MGELFFLGLPSLSLLWKCSRGSTQNLNESYHNILMTMLAKKILISFENLLHHLVTGKLVSKTACSMNCIIINTTLRRFDATIPDIAYYRVC